MRERERNGRGTGGEHDTTTRKAWMACKTPERELSNEGTEREREWNMETQQGGVQIHSSELKK
jgi:hypothetical protein